MKTKFIVLFLVVLFLSSSTKVFAEDATPSSGINGSFFNVGEINQMLKDASASVERKQIQLQNIIKRSDMMITKRIASLDNLLKRIQNDKKLTDSEKASLTSDIQSVITGLTNLKSTIDADTDPTKALADSKTIVTDFHVFSQLEPKIRLLVTLNNLKTTTINVSNLLPKVQSIITQLNGQGKDTSGLTSLMNDISSQLATINTTLTNDIASVNGIKIGSSNNDSVFSKVKSDINDIVKTGFVKIKDDFFQMRILFKTLILGNK